METMRTMYGEKREYIEDIFSADLDLEVSKVAMNMRHNLKYPKDEAKKNKRHRKSESASTSPDIRYKENGCGGSGAKTGDVVKDINENISDNDKMDTNDTAQQEMTETNPAFLKYLQFKVNFVVGKYKLDGGLC